MTTATASRDQLASVRSGQQKAWSAVFFALLILTFGAVLTRASLDAGMSAISIAALRLLIAWAIVTPVVLLQHRPALMALQRRHILLACLAGFWLAIHFTVLALALDRAKIIVVQTLINTIPLWAALLETTLLKTRLPRVVWLGLILTIIGSSVIAVLSMMNDSPALIMPPGALFADSNSAQNGTMGAILAIIGAITAATYMVIGRRIRVDIPIMPYIWVLFGSAALVGLIFVGISGTPLIGYDSKAYFWLFLLALGPQLIAHSCINYALAHVPATLVSLASQFITITAPIAAYFAFMELPTRAEVIGSLIIASGVVIALAGQVRSWQKIRS